MSDEVELVKIGGATVAFGIGLLQYVKAQRWKRAEFVANEVKEFNALAEVRNAKLMLDWTERYVELFPEKETPEEQRVRVTGKMVVNALRPHADVRKFSQAEARIRDVFDEFFGYLERFENFIAAGLLTKEECAPYLAYWIDILGMRGMDAPRPDLVNALWTYLREYQYDGVESLLNRFDYRVEPAVRVHVEEGGRADVEPGEVEDAHGREDSEVERTS